MRKLIVGLVACVAVAAVSVLAARAENLSWDVTADFSIENGNPNGVWSYGWVNNSTFQIFDTAGRGFDNTALVSSPHWHGPLWGELSGTVFPCIWKNYDPAEFNVQTGQVSLHPGPDGEASVARWTAPAGIGSLVQVQGHFYPGDSGIMQVGIFVNGISQGQTPYWHCVDSGSFDFTSSITPGTTIDFAVYGGFFYGNTPLAATITAVPEPSTLAMLGVGGLCIVISYCRRKR
jgi:hypothetical protein